MLDSVLLLLNVWNRSQRERDNRDKLRLGAAPLLPVLRRLEEQTRTFAVESGAKQAEVSWQLSNNRFNGKHRFISNKSSGLVV